VFDEYSVPVNPFQLNLKDCAFDEYSGPVNPFQLNLKDCPKCTSTSTGTPVHWYTSTSTGTPVRANSLV
jgi:type 1 fimbria pilin